MIFLDTNIVSYYLNGNKAVTNEILNLFDEDITLCITAVNVYEVLKGFRWKKNKLFESKFNSLLRHLQVYTIDDTVIDIASKLYALLRKKGISIGDADILIAAIVIANNGTLITNNTKHFENIEQLKVENWL